MAPQQISEDSSVYHPQRRLHGPLFAPHASQHEVPMRFRSPLAAVALTAIAAACTDDSRSPLPTQPPNPNADVTITQLACDADGQARVREIIGILYADKSSATSREALLKKFRQGLSFPLPAQQLERFKKFVDIMRRVDDDYEAGRLPNLTNPTDEALIAELIARLFVCAGYDEPDVPEGGDVIICIIGDPGQKHTCTASGGDYAVETPPGMFSQPVVILGSKQSDDFLVQSIYQEFPIKTEITVNPSGMEVPGKQSIVKVCQYEEDFADDGPNRAFMRIAQRHNEGDNERVDVLQFTTGGPFLTCPESAPGPDISGAAGFLSRTLAAASRTLRGAGALAVSTFAPRELHAASMVDGGVGGLADDFFSFYAGVEVPDLIIQSITLDPPSPTNASVITFSIVVQNIGRGRSPATTLRFRATATSEPENIAVGPLLPSGEGGGTTTVTSAEYTLVAGDYVATATADFPNAVEELNETAAVPFANNVLTRNYTVEAGPIIGFDDTNILNRKTLGSTSSASRMSVQTVALRGAR